MGGGTGLIRGPAVSVDRSPDMGWPGVVPREDEGEEEGQLGNPCTALKHADTLPRCCQL